MSQNTALKIENGMSCFELLQAKISSLEALYNDMENERLRRHVAIEAMERSVNNMSVSRRDRLELSIEIPIQKESLVDFDRRTAKVYAELKGMRKALDLILMVSNSGGELTAQNRPQIEAILNY